MEKLDDSRKKKIEEMVQEAIARGGAGGRPGPAAAAAPAAGRPPSRQASNVSATSSSRPGTARSSPKALAPKSLNRPAAAAGAAAKGGAAGAALRRTASSGPASVRGAARGGAGGSGGAAAPEEDLSVGKLTNEELEARMVESFGASTGVRACCGWRGEQPQTVLEVGRAAWAGGPCRCGMAPGMHFMLRPSSKLPPHVARRRTLNRDPFPPPPCSAAAALRQVAGAGGGHGVGAGGGAGAGRPRPPLLRAGAVRGIPARLGRQELPGAGRGGKACGAMQGGQLALQGVPAPLACGASGCPPACHAPSAASPAEGTRSVWSSVATISN